MNEFIQLASQMQWPFAFAVGGLGAAICVMFVVSRTSRMAEHNESVRRKNDVEMKRLDLQNMNKALPMKRSEYSNEG